MKMRILIALCAALAPAAASAAILASDDFSYPDGSLVGNGGWANHSGTVGDLLVSGGQAVVEHGAPSEDANLAFAPQSSGILTATFDIVVSDDSVISGSDSEYFAHFFPTGSFNFVSRVDVVPGQFGGDFSLGISSTTSTAEATMPVDYNFGDTLSLALSYDFSTGTGSLTVGGDTISGNPSTPEASLDLFALRQSDSSNNETVVVDNLVISSEAIPEPGTAVLALLSLASVGAVSMRSRLG
ncbi:hypothetical protein Pla108_25160 [Botrimarina colliarenosi]|uniref:PEP-CTERM protein-sorting domain-containing protein n=1 Tax=Botrimarina colliarenosi TaxID=2528001 RepID=A0A5C6A9Q1_9BACT|nr:PEP-CTERM sorting domain-containing protein [Botrimarina colliarenosi]TWT96742.1 hypothetical protein Pla108_25160 [Botrimarina colliarenosi]